MDIAVYTRDSSLREKPRFQVLMESLAKLGFGFYDVCSGEDLRPATDMVMSVGGDGTFLSASKRMGKSQVPLLGVNMGRVGFLSEYTPEEVLDALVSGAYDIEDRTLLDTKVNGRILSEDTSFWPYTLNEISVHRSGAAILGVEVSLDGNRLPTYWADGLLVATSSGSTAYSLSVGGPICSPDSKVIIIAPIAPHNLNVRPLVVPDTTKVVISTLSRDDKVLLSMDNRGAALAPDASLSIGVAQFSLKRVRLGKSSFFKALTTKLFWGEDIRNGSGI